jgi:hypothetical protein
MLHEAVIETLKQKKAIQVSKKIEQTFWNPFWKAYSRRWQSKEFYLLWVGDINGDWIWTRREELFRCWLNLMQSRHNATLDLFWKESYHFRQRNTEKLLKLAAGFSQRTIATGNSAFQSRFRIWEKTMSVMSFTTITQLQSTSGWFENCHLLVVYALKVIQIHFIKYKRNSVHI